MHCPITAFWKHLRDATAVQELVTIEEVGEGMSFEDYGGGSGNKNGERRTKGGVLSARGGRSQHHRYIRVLVPPHG